MEAMMGSKLAAMLDSIKAVQMAEWWAKIMDVMSAFVLAS